ncbi:mobile element transfer protein [Streptomyces pseudogriseolus]
MNRRFRNLRRIGPVNVASYVERGRNRHLAARTHRCPA